MWLIVTSLMSGSWPAQHGLARGLRIEGPTLTRHLDGLEQARLVTRRRAPDNRRAVQVELTDAGREKHAELLQAVIAFNRRLRSGFTEAEISEPRALLSRLEQNVRPVQPAEPS
jgi:MarR family transcriptional regulator for hemolysin